MGPKRTRDSGLSKDRRGQTLQDFALGVTLFVLTVTFVFGLFPGYLSPFTAGADGGDQMRAERISEQLVQNHSTPGNQNVLNVTQLNRTLNLDQSGLQRRYGLARVASVNITVVDSRNQSIVVEGTDRLATSQDSRNQPAASTARIVRLSNESLCRPGCRLVVKVW
jgi:hypothetical protein